MSSIHFTMYEKNGPSKYDRGRRAVQTDYGGGGSDDFELFSAATAGGDVETPSTHVYFNAPLILSSCPFVTFLPVGESP